LKTNLLTIFLANMIVLSIGLAACSNDQTAAAVQMVGQSDIPLFDRATLDDGTLEEIRQNMYDAEVASLPDMTIEVTAYTTDVTVDEVVAWYDEALTADWTKYEGMEQNGVIVTRWGQGENAAFVIFYMADPDGGDTNRLFMEYAWK
jgi:hypothetical protein